MNKIQKLLAPANFSKGSVNRRVLILFGSFSGNAESLAYRAAEAIQCAGFDARVANIADCRTEMLTRESYVLIVTSTYGDGEPPDDARPLWEAVVWRSDLNLPGLKFSVLALGNSTYDRFCQCGKDFDAGLERLGATRLFPRVDCDTDFDRPANFWIEGVVASLKQDRVACSRRMSLRTGCTVVTPGSEPYEAS